MFEHLDDPNPPMADAAARQSVHRRAAARQTRQRLLGALVAAVVLAAGIGVAVAATRGGGGGGRVHVVSPSTTAASTPTTVPPTTTSTNPPGPPLACAPLLPVAPAGAPRSATATLGSVTAELSGVSSSAFGQNTLQGARLVVSDGGRQLFTVAVSPPKGLTGAQAVVIPWSIGTVESGAVTTPLCLARFASSAPPVALVGLTTGGAHCCTVVRAYSLPAGTATELEMGNGGALVVEGGTGAVVQTADNDFYYAFADYADSGAPRKHLVVVDGAFVEQFDHESIRADADLWWTHYTNSRANGLGFLAAWTADECRLGKDQCDQAFATLDQLNRSGGLTGPGGNPDWPTGSAFIAKLQTFLSQHGYR